MLLRAVDRAWVKVADELLMATISAVGRREKGVEAATWRTFVEISSLISAGVRRAVKHAARLPRLCNALTRTGRSFLR